MSDADVTQILKNHQGLVIKLAKYHINIMNTRQKQRSYSMNHDYQEFLQVGNLGLLQAIEKFDLDHNSGAAFNTYAFYWVRQSINKYLLSNASLIKLPHRW